jgi:hypothetical protein
MINQQRDWILFLQMTSKLPWSYLLLSSAFKTANKTLVPMSFEQTLEIKHVQDFKHVILFTSSQVEKNFFNQHAKIILSRLIQQKKISLYHFNSFEDCKIYSLKKTLFYTEWQLPIEIGDVFPDILSAMNAAEKDYYSNRWTSGNAAGMKRVA